MKTLLKLFLFVCLSNIAFGQTDQELALSWKLDEDDTILYRTIMQDIDTSTFKFDFGEMGELFNAIADDSLMPEMDNFFEKVSESIQKKDYITKLYADQDAVNIEMSTVEEGEEYDLEKLKQAENKEDIDVDRIISSLMDGVVLRGSVYKTGGIKSFWLKSRQKNLIAVLFELPHGKVRVGDSWELEVNFIANDHNFQCDSSYHKNEVTLIDVIVEEGDTIAVLKYDIQEFVTGDFKSPFSDVPKTTTMLMTHEAIGKFSVSKGRWVAYDGIMSLISSGVMTSNSRQSFSLAPIE